MNDILKRLLEDIVYHPETETLDEDLTAAFDALTEEEDE